MPASEQPRISVVNDNPEFLELMSAILAEDAGYEVTLFNGDETSVDTIAASAPDLLIIDLLLGGASGWEIVALARSDVRFADVPILICSADVGALRDRQEELERIGDVHVLRKPFGVDELTDAVSGLLDRRRATTG
jgi:DNA-binding response OmpR family regulator